MAQLFCCILYDLDFLFCIRALFRHMKSADYLTGPGMIKLLKPIQNIQNPIMSTAGNQNGFFSLPDNEALFMLEGILHLPAANQLR